MKTLNVESWLTKTMKLKTVTKSGMISVEELKLILRDVV